MFGFMKRRPLEVFSVGDRVIASRKITLVDKKVYPLGTRGRIFQTTDHADCVHVVFDGEDKNDACAIKATHIRKLDQ